MGSLDEEAHGGEVDLSAEDTTLLPQDFSKDSTKQVVAVSSFVSTTLWLLALAGCLALITSSFSDNGGMTRMFEVKPSREIMLFGDSLVGVSEDKYHIAEHLEDNLEDSHSDFEITVSTSASNGNCARDLLKRVEADVLNRPGENPPDGVVILFDSDAADVDTAERYKKTLSSLIGKITKKVDYVALAGPILDGELKEGRNEKDDILNDYEDINIAVSKEYNIDYIPLREYFFAHEKKSEHAEEQDSGKLTVDGEHPLHDGADIIQENIQKTVMKWHNMWVISDEDRKELEKMNDLSVVVPSFFSNLYNGIFGEAEEAPQSTTPQTDPAVVTPQTDPAVVTPQTSPFIDTPVPNVTASTSVRRR